MGFTLIKMGINYLNSRQHMKLAATSDFDLLIKGAETKKADASKHRYVKKVFYTMNFHIENCKICDLHNQ